MLPKDKVAVIDGLAALLAAGSPEPSPGGTRSTIAGAPSLERDRRAAPAISESIGIPSHLSLPPFDTWRSVYPMASNERWAANGTVGHAP
jgi:hypothetical protein